MKEVLLLVQVWEWQVQWLPMRAVGDQVIVEATIIEDTTMVAPAPEEDGIRAATTGETQ